MPDSVIVDLSGLDEILRMDVRNKAAMIQPGVTFEDLQEACHKAGLRVPLPLLPRKTKSVMAGYLEREPHTIPKYHGDMSDPICCLEEVFGTGDLFRTGSASGPGTLEQQWAAGQAQKTPMGPSQTDFMKIPQGSQGTLGIATCATIKLEVLPKAQKSFFVTAQLAAVTSVWFPPGDEESGDLTLRSARPRSARCTVRPPSAPSFICQSRFDHMRPPRDLTIEKGLGFGDDRICGPWMGNCHHWQSKVKQAFDPDKASDGGFSVPLYGEVIAGEEAVRENRAQRYASRRDEGIALDVLNMGGAHAN